VAVRAHERAFAGLLASLGQRPREPGVGQREALAPRLEVMELERSHVPVVSAERAAATGLRDQDLLHPPTAQRHRLRAAPQAPPPAVAATDERRLTVDRAAQLRPLGRCQAATPASLRSEPVMPEPLGDRLRRAAELHGDRPDGQSSLDGGLQRRPLHDTNTSSPAGQTPGASCPGPDPFGQAPSERGGASATHP